MKYLIVGSRGGVNRARILEALHEEPRNAFQLAMRLRLDYKTVCHHLEVLEDHGMILRPKGDAYGAVYVLSRFLEVNYSTFVELARRVLPEGRVPEGAE